MMLYKCPLVVCCGILISCSAENLKVTEGIIPEIQEVYTEFDQVENLSGKILFKEWKSVNLNEDRSITIYLPPNYTTEKSYGVLIGTDNIGISLPHFAEYLIVNEVIDPIIIVGINLRESQAIDTIFGDYQFDFRNLEFFKSEEIFVQKKSSPNANNKSSEFCSDFDENPNLLKELGFEEIVSNRYERFTSYINNEIIPFIKQNYSVSNEISEWTLGGSSSGAAFVYNFTCDYPGVFGNAIAMSPAGPFDRYDFSKSTSKYFLAAGNNESFLKESLNYIPELEKYGIPFLHKTYNAGHDWQMWLSFYLDCLEIIYKKD